jgi:hypothetical protein
VLEEFGTVRARPWVVSAYTPLWGFRRVKPRLRFTTDVARHLQAQGVSTVELVWRRRRVRMNVTEGFRSVWGTDEAAATPDAATGLQGATSA